uniref:BZIP domain-containing protein n=1 Tax=Strongyloides venezuelensis TaxID=75913 RepID=A0A0K0F420_STRVS
MISFKIFTTLTLVVLGIIIKEFKTQESDDDLSTKDVPNNDNFQRKLFHDAFLNDENINILNSENLPSVIISHQSAVVRRLRQRLKRIENRQRVQARKNRQRRQRERENRRRNTLERRKRRQERMKKMRETRAANEKKRRRERQERVKKLVEAARRAERNKLSSTTTSSDTTAGETTAESTTTTETTVESTTESTTTTITTTSSTTTAKGSALSKFEKEKAVIVLETLKTLDSKKEKTELLKLAINNREVADYSDSKRTKKCRNILEKAREEPGSLFARSIRGLASLSIFGEESSEEETDLLVNLAVGEDPELSEDSVVSYRDTTEESNQKVESSKNSFDIKK